MMKKNTHIVIATLVMGLLVAPLGVEAKDMKLAHHAHQTGPVHHPTALHLNKTERSFGIPRGLLSAISKVESGRMTRDQKGFIPWPWALNVGGEGRFYSSKSEAITAAQALLKKGVRNFDVGLMQVNLHHHPQAFRSLDEAFDPGHNVRYAAQFLKTLKQRHGSWEKAIAHYHSANPEHHIPYRKKVMAFWRTENQQGHTPYPLRWEDAIFDRTQQSFKGRLISRPWQTIQSTRGYHGPRGRYQMATPMGSDQDFLQVFRNKVRSNLHRIGKGKPQGFQYKRGNAPSWYSVGMRLHREGSRKNP